MRLLWHPQVVVQTGDVRGAGTDANVYLVMHGVLGDGGRHVLAGGAEDFDRWVRAAAGV